MQGVSPFGNHFEQSPKADTKTEAVAKNQLPMANVVETGSDTLASAMTLGQKMQMMCFRITSQGVISGLAFLDVASCPQAAVLSSPRVLRM